MTAAFDLERRETKSHSLSEEEEILAEIAEEDLAKGEARLDEAVRAIMQFFARSITEGQSDKSLRFTGKLWIRD